MFVDFEKVFQKKPQTELPIPKAIVEHLNDQLPQGLKYIADETSVSVVSQDGSPLRFDGFRYAPTREQEQVLGNEYSTQDILDFSYNAQQNIPIVLNKEGFLIVNDSEIPVERLVMFPHNPLRYISGSAFVSPPPFDPPFKLSFGCKKYSRTLEMARVPHMSIYISSFESQKQDPLQVRYTYDTKTNSMTLNISYDLSRAKSIRDCVEVPSIYNAFLDGKGYIAEIPFPTKLNSKDVHKFNEESLAFWEKVLKIEEFLEVKFTPSFNAIDFDTMCIVEQLYQNLIKTTPISDTNKVDSIDGIWNVDHKQNIQDSIGKTMYFEFEGMAHISLFGVELELPTLRKVFNTKLISVTQEEGKHKLTLEDADETNPRFTVMLCFKDIVALKNFQEENQGNSVAQFRNARRAREYILNSTN